LGNRINNIISHFNTSTSCTDIYLLANALAEHIDQNNNEFSVRQSPDAYRTPIRAEHYINLMQKLRDFAEGKEKISYIFINGSITVMKDLNVEEQPEISFIDKLKILKNISFDKLYQNLNNFINSIKFSSD